MKVMGQKAANLGGQQQNLLSSRLAQNNDPASGAYGGKGYNQQSNTASVSPGNIYSDAGPQPFSSRNAKNSGQPNSQKIQKPPLNSYR